MSCGAEPIPTATPVPPPKTLNVAVGADDTVEALEMMTFLPANLFVNEGDTITFSKKVAEPHTITFNAPVPPPADFLPRPDGRLELNPQLFFAFPPPAGPPGAPGTPANLSVSFDGTGYVSSGVLLTKEDVFKVTFTKSGIYPYLCLIHPQHMRGTIAVNPAGFPGVKQAADYDKEGADHITTHKTNAKKLFDEIKVPAPSTATDGSRTFTVYAAAGNGPQGNDFLRFIGGENLTVKAGDKVNWKWEKNPAGAPHTVTFLSGAEAPGFVVPEPQPAGPPKLFVNPQFLVPAPLPPAPYGGTGYYNSGLLIAVPAGPPPGAPPGARPPPPVEFTLAFTKPGIYKYLCLLHDPSGMNGTITVTQ
jgi:plastocyanin